MIACKEFTFFHGEMRKITYSLLSKNGQNFSIESATSELFRDNEILDTLHTEINGHDIEFMIDTAQLTNGYYHVIMTCKINEETVKNKMVFMVKT